MLKKIFKDVYLNEVILPKNPLRAINCYMIKKGDRVLVIDSAFDHEESEKIFFDGLEELGAEIGKTDMFLTHLHADHSGLAFKFKEKYKGKIYCSAIDTEYINKMKYELYANEFVPILKIMGINPDFEFFKTHPGLVYCVKNKLETTLVKEGDTIDLGDFYFEVIDVSGHTPGHLAIYERKNKILFSGDHILNKITPNISFWSFEHGDILGKYIKHLDKIANMDINLIFSAHRKLIDTPKERISELKEHYAIRNTEVYKILKNKEKMNSFEMAREMRWDFRAANFDEFPNNQKWFATGEALANLEHLRAKNLAEYEFIDGIAYYKAKKTNKFYGSRLCPDCIKAFEYLDKISYEYEFIDITKNMLNLKEFLALRDNKKEFFSVKQEGHVGIPTILTVNNQLIIEEKVFEIKNK